MDYPIKYVVVENGVVTGCTTIYVPGATFQGPPGSITVELSGDSPVDVGWKYVLNEDNNQYEFHAP